MTFPKLKSAISVLAVFFFLCSGAFGANARHKSLSDRKGDEDAIRKQVETFCRAFQIGDAGIIASMWADDGTLVDSTGEKFSGRAAIQKAYRDFFSEKGAQPIVVSVSSITFPAANVAIEEGLSNLPQSDSEGACYTAVHIKRNGKWQMMNVMEAPNVTKSDSDNLKDLDWMVGDWTAQGQDHTVPFQAEWISNQKFLRCIYYAGDKDKTVKGMKLVGWDPIRKQIITWHFSDDGGYGFGTLYRQGEGWTEAVRSVQADGGESSAVYKLTPKDKDNFLWQSIQRQLNGAPLPDTGIVQVTRNK